MISDIEIPTGVPLVYDLESRCVHLFDDGVRPLPRDRYNFGTAGDAIFRPCGDDSDDGCPLDPHLYLDDAFCEDSRIDPVATAAAEREAWERVLELDSDQEEFTTEVRDFWAEQPRGDARVFADLEYSEI